MKLYDLKKKVKRKRWNSWRLIFCYWIVFKNICPKKCIKDAAINKPNCLLWASCYFLFFSVYLFVISLKKQNDTRQKKKKGIIVSCIYLQGFPAEMSKYSISWELSTHIAWHLLGNTRSEVGNICISSWFQLARWSTINWQQIGNVINPIIKFSKLAFASEMSCKLPWSIWRVTRKSNRLF